MQGIPQTFYQNKLEYRNTIPPQIMYTVPRDTSLIVEVFFYIQKSDNAGYAEEQNKDDFSLFILKQGEPVPTDWANNQVVGYRLDEEKGDRRFQNYQLKSLYLSAGDMIYGQGFYCTTSIYIAGLAYKNSVIQAQEDMYTIHIPNISSQLTSIATSLGIIQVTQSQISVILGEIRDCICTS